MQERAGRNINGWGLFSIHGRIRKTPQMTGQELKTGLTYRLN